MSDIECLVEVWEITEYRDNSVYQTKFKGLKWIDIDDRNNPPKGFQYVPQVNDNPQSPRRIKEK